MSLNKEKSKCCKIAHGSLYDCEGHKHLKECTCISTGCDHPIFPKQDTTDWITDWLDKQKYVYIDYENGLENVILDGTFNLIDFTESLRQKAQQEERERIKKEVLEIYEKELPNELNTKRLPEELGLREKLLKYIINLSNQ